MITIDGSEGEGGGQILRTALSLSVATGKPFAIKNIRARRSKPGLMRQHLTAVNAAAEISGARVRGAEVGAASLLFEPGPARPGDYVFRIGSAGSTTLVLQTVLAPLALASGRSHLVIEGGTHNQGAPSFEFIDRAFLPVLRRIGYDVSAVLKRPGFYPAGGGVIEVEIGPTGESRPLILEERGASISRKAEAILANLPGTIAERELAVLAPALGFAPHELFIRSEPSANGPGNCLLVTFEYETICEVVTAFGRVGASSEKVAAEATSEARAYLACGAPVGSHLADQLILPMVLASGGRFVTAMASSHLLTNIRVVGLFLDAGITIAELDADRCRVAIDTRGGTDLRR